MGLFGAWLGIRDIPTYNHTTMYTIGRVQQTRRSINDVMVYAKSRTSECTQSESRTSAITERCLQCLVHTQHAVSLSRVQC